MAPFSPTPRRDCLSQTSCQLSPAVARFLTNIAAAHIKLVFHSLFLPPFAVYHLRDSTDDMQFPTRSNRSNRSNRPLPRQQQSSSAHVNSPTMAGPASSSERSIHDTSVPPLPTTSPHAPPRPRRLVSFSLFLPFIFLFPNPSSYSPPFLLSNLLFAVSPSTQIKERSRNLYRQYRTSFRSYSLSFFCSSYPEWPLPPLPNPSSDYATQSICRGMHRGRSCRLPYETDSISDSTAPESFRGKVLSQHSHSCIIRSVKYPTRTSNLSSPALATESPPIRA